MVLIPVRGFGSFKGIQGRDEPMDRSAETDIWCVQHIIHHEGLTLIGEPNKTRLFVTWCYTQKAFHCEFVTETFSVMYFVSQNVMPDGARPRPDILVFVFESQKDMTEGTRPLPNSATTPSHHILTSLSILNTAMQF